MEDTRNGLRIEAKLIDAASSTAVMEGDYVRYPGGAPGSGDVIHRVTNDGTEDFYVFQKKPLLETVSYNVTLAAGVAGLRLVSRTLEFLDATGTPWLRINPPWILGADGEIRYAQLMVAGCAADHNPSGPWGRPVTAPLSDTCLVSVDWSNAGVSYPALLDPGWSSTGALATPRSGYASTIFTSGGTKKVLIAGGGGNGAGWGSLSSCEIYDSSSATYSATGSLAVERQLFAGATITIGTASGFLVAGGLANSIHTGDTTTTTHSAEFYSFGSGTWTTKNAMNKERLQPTATILQPGSSVLVAGGIDGSSSYVNTAEKYSALPEGWATPSTMNKTRYLHTQTNIGAGLVLVAGGYDGSYNQTAEVYDDSSASWTLTSNMALGETNAQATLLADGRVLVAGSGTDAQLYDPLGGTSCGAASGTWASTGAMNVGRADHALVQVPGGAIVAGGYHGYPPTYVSSAELYDAKAGTWSQTSTSMADTRGFFALTYLSPTLGILAAGGFDSNASPQNIGTSDVFKQLTNATLCSNQAACQSGNCNTRCCNKQCGCGGVCSSLSGNCIGTASLFGSTGTCTGHLLCDGTNPWCPPSCGEFAPCASGYGCGLCTSGICSLCSTQTSASTLSFTTSQCSTISSYASSYTGLGYSSGGSFQYNNMAVGNFFKHIYPDIVEVSSDGFGHDPTGDGTGIAIYEGSSTQVGGNSTCSAPSWASSYSSSSNFFAVTTGDFDGDGISDIVLAQLDLTNGADNIYFILKNATGACLDSSTMQKISIGSGSKRPMDLAIGDFNADGLPDVVAADYGTNEVSVFGNVNSSPNRFSLQTTITGIDGTGSAPSHIATADFDGDSYPDIVVTASRNAGSTTSGITIVRGTGAFTFSASRYHPSTTTGLSGPWIGSMTVADFNQDSKPDIAFTDISDNKIHVLMNTTGFGTLGFTESVYSPPSTAPSGCTSGATPYVVRGGDVNNDAYPDLVLGYGCGLGANSGEVAFYLYQPLGGTFSLNSAMVTSGVANISNLVLARSQSQSCKLFNDVFVSHYYNGSNTNFNIASCHNTSH